MVKTKRRHINKNKNKTRKNIIKNILIDSNFESGNIKLLSKKNNIINLEIEKEPYPKSTKRKYQNWFYFKASNMLNKKGYIFGVVHDESSGLARMLGKRWPAYCLQHPHLFNPKTIENLFSKINLEKISVYKTINSFKIGYLISQLILAIFKKNIKCPELFNVNLKLGNIGFIFKK